MKKSLLVLIHLIDLFLKAEPMRNFSLVFLIVAIVLFILAAVGVGIIPNVGAWALVFFAASFLPLN